MSNQSSNVWQTASHKRTNTASNAANQPSRTPQNRSGRASPAASQQASKPAPAPPNAWAQRSSNANTANSSPALHPQDDASQPQHRSVNGFDAAQVKAFLSREAAPAVYKPVETPGAGRGAGGAWAVKANHMANNQPFFVQLAKQVATFESGGG